MNLLFANDRQGQYPQSWYADAVTLPDARPPLRGEASADVCIVGAGYTGLSAAWQLAAKGLSVIVVEAHRAGWGASGRNGGQVGSGFNKGQEWLENRVGVDNARALWSIAEEAKAQVRALASEDETIAYRPGVAHAEWHERDVPDTQADADYLAQNYGYDQVQKLDRDEMQALIGSPCYQGGSVDWGAGHVNPLALALALARKAEAAGAVIHENTLVHRVEPSANPVVRCDKGFVRAKHVILAGNGYLGRLVNGVASRVMPINNFIAATEPLGDRVPSVLARDIAVADSKFVINYFRLSADGRLLFGGGESYGYKFPSDIPATVRKPLETVFPQLKGVKITHAWGGTLGISAQRLPVFDRPAQGLWAASGYSGHGVALASFSGTILAEAIAGQMGRFDVLNALPSPRFPGGGAFRSPLLVMAMSWYALRDKLGI
ncbi:NAD(P)/FAD-dependent oxidoreductase [Donghicola mangrovi]|uniref:FAD-binding oxidoreductase n=1 Tax=Donghicola mangrovi TaxID=2729614 RepID=A0A850QAZ4_9RHOB|nr:FAD-binding oxidoreductase [Donghicola mangrovi]NVO23449.1 FAD-binding oxidoreductase [Donghicola mangrovi]